LDKVEERFQELKNGLSSKAEETKICVVKTNISRPISKKRLLIKNRIWQRYQETRDIKRLQEYKKVR